MRLLVFSDIHIHPYEADDVRGSRLNNCLDALSQAFMKAVDYGADAVLFAGDLYDQGKALRPEVVDEVIKTLAACFKVTGLNLYAISGNHDQAGNNTPTRPARTALSHVEGVFPGRFHLLDNKTIGLGQIDASQRVLVHGVPYYPKTADFAKALEAAQARREAGAYNILLCHQHPPECEFGADFVVAQVLGFDQVFCGHIHRHWCFHMHGPVGFYSVGSPLPRDLADDGDIKGYMLVDVPSGYATRVVTNYPYITRVASQVAGGFVLPDDPGLSSEAVPVATNPVELLTAYAQQAGLTDAALRVGKRCLPL